MRLPSSFQRFTPKSLRQMTYLALAFFSLGFFVKLTWELHEGEGLDGWDGAILRQVGRLRFAGLNGPAVDVTALGSPTVVVLIALISGTILWLLRSKRGLLFLLLSTTGAGLLVTLVKHLMHRARPEVIPHLVQVTDYSYPSGHTIASTVVYLSLALLASRHFVALRDRTLLFSMSALIIGLVAFSRLYLGVHFPSDVLSGVLLGAGWTFGLAAFFFGKAEGGGK